MEMSSATHPSAALLGGHAYYIHWGVIQISLTNLLVIAAMIVLFVLALVLPFPGSRDELAQHAERRDGGPSDE